MQKPKILFLYTELAAYFLACIKQLAQQSSGEIHIVRWPVNNEAPFEFGDLPDNVGIYDRNMHTTTELMELTEKIQPNVIYCSGWIDKSYIKVCQVWRKKVPVVGGFDTQWKGNLKQWLNVALSPFTIKKYFSHVWVAGEPQKKYAIKLGFAPNRILMGVYSADVAYFNQLYQAKQIQNTNTFPKRFIYVGRYLEFKGVFDLWEAFIQSKVHETGWELWCLGTGDLWDKRIEHHAIKHIGFVQPSQMNKYINQTTVFVLPSRFEPWAVALHEFCAAGFPVIVSDQVGAATAFVQHHCNGYIFKAGEVDQLAKCFQEFSQTTDLQIIEMGKKSHELAQTITPESWSATLLSLLKTD